MTRGSFEDNKKYAIDGKDYCRIFHKGPCIAVNVSRNGEAFKNVVEVVNFFYPVKEEEHLMHIKLGDEIYAAYDISMIHSLIDCNDNWVCCLEEVKE